MEERGPSFLLADSASALEMAIERNLLELSLGDFGGKREEYKKGEPVIEEGGWGEVTGEAGGQEEWVTIVEEDPDTGAWVDFVVPKSYAQEVWKRRPQPKASYWGEREEREREGNGNVKGETGRGITRETSHVTYLCGKVQGRTPSVKDGGPRRGLEITAVVVFLVCTDG